MSGTRTFCLLLMAAAAIAAVVMLLPVHPVGGAMAYAAGDFHPIHAAIATEPGDDNSSWLPMLGRMLHFLATFHLVKFVIVAAGAAAVLAFRVFGRRTQRAGKPSV